MHDELIDHLGIKPGYTDEDKLQAAEYRAYLVRRQKRTTIYRCVISGISIPIVIWLAYYLHDAPW